MFERFTDEARAVVGLAEDEARTLRHHYLGTEHLLLGLVGSGGVASATLERLGIHGPDVRSDVTAAIDTATEAEPVHDDTTALRSIGIDLDEVRSRVEEAFGPGALDRSRRPRDRRRRGRCDDVPGRLPFTPRAKKVLELSLREAVRLHHPSIGTEHILLGLVRAGEGVAVEILAARGATARRVRDAVTQELSRRGELPGRSA